MLALLRSALVFWISLFEIITGWQGWWGLSWLGKSRLHILLAPVALWSLLPMRAQPRRAALALLLMLPVALLLHLAGSNLRHWRLNPMRSLVPGDYPQRRVERLDIPLDDGHVPALHIAPMGGAKAAVCVAHGSGCNKTFYIWRLVDAMLERGLAVLLIDLDGHGENPRAQRFPEMLDSIAGPVNWLRERYERVALIGYSLGACLAGRAVANGLQVDAVALLQGPPKLVFSKREERREGILLLRPSMYHMSADSSVYHIIRAWQSWPIRAAISTWDLIDLLDIKQSIQQINAPLLLAYGGKDAIVPISQAMDVHAVLPPRADWHVVKQASHLSLILEPEMLQVMGDWLVDKLGATKDPAMK